MNKPFVNKLSFTLEVKDLKLESDQQESLDFKQAFVVFEIDGKPLNKVGQEFDFAEIIASSFFGHDFYLFTCSCGVPGCANYHNPVELAIIEDQNLVYWTFPQEPGYKELEGEVYKFDLKAYLQLIESLQTQLIALNEKGVHVFSPEYTDCEDPPGLELLSLEKSIKNCLYYFANNIRREFLN